MSTPAFTLAKSSTKLISLISLVLGASLVTSFAPCIARADWNIDFSRRTKATRDSDLLSTNLNDVPSDSSRSPASVDDGAAPVRRKVTEDALPDQSPAKGVFDTLFDAGEPMQEIVIMQTEKGFVPSTVRVRKNGKYKIFVVNVNEKEKNVSFILDGFSEHHATYYGKIKTFVLEPKKEGAYSFESPETSAEGKLVVFNPQISLRAPASASAADGSEK